MEEYFTGDTVKAGKIIGEIQGFTDAYKRVAYIEDLDGKWHTVGVPVIDEVVED